jgi:hypothetical protein
MTDVAVAQNTSVDQYRGETGTEHMGQDDFTIPRIHLGQGLSPAVQAGKVKEGDLYLNIDEVALEQPVLIVPIIASKEYLLWRNRDVEEGGVMARATYNPKTKLFEWDQPNTKFETVYGKPPKKVVYETGDAFDSQDTEGLHTWGTAFPEDPDSPPAATVHHNYVVLLPEHDMMIAGMSLSRSSLSRARNFNTMLHFGSGSGNPMWYKAYSLSSESDKSGNHTYMNYSFRPAGNSTDEQREYAAMVRDSLIGRVSFDESEPSQEDDSL